MHFLKAVARLFSKRKDRDTNTHTNTHTERERERMRLLSAAIINPTFKLGAHRTDGECSPHISLTRLVLPTKMTRGRHSTPVTEFFMGFPKRESKSPAMRVGSSTGTGGTWATPQQKLRLGDLRKS